MKTRILSITGVVAFAILTGLSVKAQSTRLLAAEIPFNFYVSDKALPAGEYRFEATQLGGSDALKIQSKNGHFTVFVQVRLSTPMSNKFESIVRFHRLGDQYFLSQVQGFEEKAVYTLSRSHLERSAFARSKSTPKQSTVSITKRGQ